jgi:hypothetical protein
MFSGVFMAAMYHLQCYTNGARSSSGGDIQAGILDDRDVFGWQRRYRWSSGGVYKAISSHKVLAIVVYFRR